MTTVLGYNIQKDLYFLGMKMHRRSHQEAHWRAHQQAAHAGIFDDLWEGFDDVFASFGGFGSANSFDGFGEIPFGDFHANPATMYMKETNQGGCCLVAFLIMFGLAVPKS